ncbi:hypothetical protein [Terasakiella sp.]|uniref:hypothetical protein n=1 Tax=Terasakiella sp. TaxID=2034861 RepID=UPI003AA7CBD1
MLQRLKLGWIIGGLLSLSACGYVDKYEEAVYEEEPRYCYQQLGSVKCFSEPVHRDAARLVNYYGPHPNRYDTPSPPDRLESVAPPPVAFYVRDEEPIPDDSTVHPATDQ